MRHIAIVGSGPAGYYTAETLQKAEDIAVDVIDRLPVPYGLIRTGVAPDHQSIKAVSRRYEGTALADNVRFVGHVAVGTDVTIDELVELVAYEQTRDLLSGKITVDFPRWTYDHEFTDIGIRQASDGHARYTITEGDPLSADISTHYRVTQTRADGVFTHESTSRMTCDATHFHVQAEIILTENGTEIFRRNWQEAIPRDHL